MMFRLPHFVTRHIPAAGVTFAMVGLLWLTAGCATKELRDDGAAQVSEGPGIDEYYPLAVGNTWVYKLDFRGHVEQKTISIVSQQERAFVDSAGARWLIDKRGLRDEGKRYTLRVPLTIGTHWKAIASEVSVENYEISDVKAKVSTPAGNFGDCIEVHATNMLKQGFTQHAWQTYCPGVGLTQVRVEMRVGDKPPLKQSQIDLVYYDVKGPGQPRTGGVKPE